MKKALFILALLNISITLPAQSVAILEFEKSMINLGKLQLNDTVRFEMKYKNTGTKALIVTDIKSQCSCTHIEFPALPLLPGKESSLKITLIANTAGKFYKEIYVYSNTEISPQVISLKGIVK